MMTDPIVVEVGDEGAGEVGAIGTPGYPWLICCTQPYLTIAAVRYKAASAEAAIAVNVLWLHFPTFGQGLD